MTEYDGYGEKEICQFGGPHPATERLMRARLCLQRGDNRGWVRKNFPAQNGITSSEMSSENAYGYLETFYFLICLIMVHIYRMVRARYLLSVYLSSDGREWSQKCPTDYSLSLLPHPRVSEGIQQCSPGYLFPLLVPLPRLGEGIQQCSSN